LTLDFPAPGDSQFRMTPALPLHPSGASERDRACQEGRDRNVVNDELLGPEAVYERHLDMVWRNLRRLGVEEAALDDAAQDVFLTVFRRWDSYDPARSSVETWLFGILFRVASRHRRGQTRRWTRFLPWSGRDAQQLTPDRDGPAELAAKRQAAVLLDRLLEELPAKYREILILVDVEQLSVPEAAGTLRVNLNTAYWRLRKARQAFEEALRRFRARERGSVR
jgi:RNA polymerase sigma-70 factor, ECF subfamily